MVNKNRNNYKFEKISYFSDRNIVMIFPGNLWVAGCFSFFGGLK